MARRVFLHVGPPKTGTSFLQEAWWQNQSALREHGLLYPGQHWMAHFHAAARVCENTTQLRRMQPRNRDAWNRLTDEISAFDGDALLSSERFAAAYADQADRALRRLEEVAAEVHVIVTARDLGRQLPSNWQQHVRSGGDKTLDQWWRAIASDEDARYWRSQDFAGLLERWSQGLPEDRAHLVVHAPPGSPKHLLWDRVCSVLGIDPTAIHPLTRMNASLGATHVELLRRVNAALPPGRNASAVGSFTKTFFAGQMIIPAMPSPPFVLPPDAHAWAVERATTMVSELRKHRYDVVGDLDDLIPDARAPEGITPQEISDADLLQLAVPVLARTLLQQKKSRDEIRPLRRAQRMRSQGRHAQGDDPQDRSRLGKVVTRARRLRASIANR
jgi:hypothetical protein